MADPVFEAFLGGGGVGDDAGLNAFRETVRSNDYFRQAAAPLLTTRLNTSMMDPWTAFGTTAAQAFLGSALNTLGKNREAEQLFKAAEVLPLLQKPDINSILGVQAPEGIDLEAFGALKLNAIRDMFKRDDTVNRAVATKGIRVKPDGSWEAIPGARDALNALEGFSPELQKVEMKLRMGQQLDEKDVSIYAAAPESAKRILGQVEYQSAIEERATGVQSRFDKGFRFKEGERGLPGFVNITGAIPSTSVIKELREKIQTNEEVKNAFKALKATGDEEKFFEMIGTEASMQEAMQASIFNAFRKRTGSGARLEGKEGEMIAAMTPRVLSGDWFGALKAAALGRNQQEFADQMIQFLDEDRDISLFSQGFKANDRPLTFYPKDQIERFGLSDLAVQPQAVTFPGATAPSPSMGGVPEVGGMFNGEKVLGITKIE